MRGETWNGAGGRRASGGGGGHGSRRATHLFGPTGAAPSAALCLGSNSTATCPATPASTAEDALVNVATEKRRESSERGSPAAAAAEVAAGA